MDWSAYFYFLTFPAPKISSSVWKSVKRFPFSTFFFTGFIGFKVTVWVQCLSKRQECRKDLTYIWGPARRWANYGIGSRSTEGVGLETCLSRSWGPGWKGAHPQGCWHRLLVRQVLVVEDPVVVESKRIFGRAMGNCPWEAFSKSREWAGKEYFQTLYFSSSEGFMLFFLLLIPLVYKLVKLRSRFHKHS